MLGLCEFGKTVKRGVRGGGGTGEDGRGEGGGVEAEGGLLPVRHVRRDDLPVVIDQLRGGGRTRRARMVS